MDELAAAAGRARHFNRFWTRLTRLLDEGLLETPHSLTEARVLYELGQVEESTAVKLVAALELDAGHLSRVLSGLEAGGLVTRRRSPDDGRRLLLALTAAGSAAFAELDRRSSEQAGELLGGLPAPARRRVLEAMGTLEDLLGAAREPQLVLRAPLPGELGWVVQAHGALYAREFGFDTSFEALVAQIVAGYANEHDPARERAWIAALDGDPVGSVFCVDAGGGVAKLRLLIVDPAARGRNVGTLLVGECIRFARATGYRELTLWTQRHLESARRIYQRTGFELVESEPETLQFGTRQASETWTLSL